ncbi:hypothetical protein [Streptomyces sp. NBC_01264]|uniref:hypothetical protein n=1 Tax=Streptomyces sp. NBC_01264 TaxID=2903804 RepID=UPI0022524F45|nr:hypothetical protein [Streptomyces sp. NBC_01264]MCX4776052.1 hypothetical protein [Streptomyces sp. NBC_01264]
MDAAPHRADGAKLDATPTAATIPQGPVADDAAATGGPSAQTLAGQGPRRAAAAPRGSERSQGLDTEAVCAVNDEARRLRLGLGGGGSWLRAHLAPDGVHYLLPDPANYYWPGTPNSEGGEIDWWQCTMLLQMSDGEQVGSMVAVLPETFTALPSTLLRKEQLRLVHRVRSIERDTSQ